MAIPVLPSHSCLLVSLLAVILGSHERWVQGLGRDMLSLLSALRMTAVWVAHARQAGYWKGCVTKCAPWSSSCPIADKLTHSLDLRIQPTGASTSHMMISEVCPLRVFWGLRQDLALQGSIGHLGEQISMAGYGVHLTVTHRL